MPTPSQAHVSFGTTFAVGTGATPAAIAGVISIDPSGDEFNAVKIGALDDSTRYFGFINGRGTLGALKLTYEYRRSNYTSFVAFKGVDGLNYVYTLPDTSTITGTCIMKSLSPPSAPEDDRQTFDVEIQPSTATWAAST